MNVFNLLVQISSLVAKLLYLLFLRPLLSPSFIVYLFIYVGNPQTTHFRAIGFRVVEFFPGILRVEGVRVLDGRMGKIAMKPLVCE